MSFATGLAPAPHPFADTQRCPADRALFRLMPELPRDERDQTLAFLRDCGLSLSQVLLSLFDQSEDCIKLLGIGGELAFMNCNGKALMQVSDFAAVAGRPWRDLWPSEARPLVDRALARARDGTASRFTADCPTGDGTWIRWDVSVSPIRDEEGEPVALIASSRVLERLSDRAG